jgi:hypothetical protein
MGKKELATLIDAYSDAKASGNKYLTQTMIAQLERALDEVFGTDPTEAPMIESAQTSEEY